jgi:hypothetical protein
MAAPVVTGTVALMLQAHPNLTPNAVKAIIEYSAQQYAGYDRLTQGAGFLNAKGAVELAQTFAASNDTEYPSTADWSTQIVWGNRLIQGGQLAADGNAWWTSTTWGASVMPDGEQITWGSAFSDTGQNVVWGSQCGGADCETTWSVFDSGVVIGTDDGDTVVWGTSDDDDGDTVVWGTSCSDPSCDPVIWNAP